jgi:hypothetical protein
MLKLPDFTAQSLNLTAAVLDVSTNEIDVRHCPSPENQPELREHNKNSKPLGVGVGSEVPPIRVRLSDALLLHGPWAAMMGSFD